MTSWYFHFWCKSQCYVVLVGSFLITISHCWVKKIVSWAARQRRSESCWWILRHLEKSLHGVTIGIQGFFATDSFEQFGKEGYFFVFFFLHFFWISVSLLLSFSVLFFFYSSLLLCFFASSLVHCAASLLLRFSLLFPAFPASLLLCFQLQNVTNSTKMLQILFTMRSSNSKMLQRQLKWQLPAPKCCK